MADKNDVFEQARDAVSQENPAALRDLLQKHPELRRKIDEPMAAFDSPLITTVRSREMLDVLLAAGADINARSRWWAGGFGLLDYASPELAAYAIERGARIDINAAARLGRVEKVREFVAQDAGLVHARGGDGQTPLHVASTVEIAEFLLTHGAAIDARDIDHESTPAQYLVRAHPAVARYLVRRGCATDLLLVSALGELDLVRQHLRENPAGVSISVCDECFPKKNPRAGGTIYNWTLGTNKTAHVVAREFGHEDVFQLLLEHSPDELRLAVACEVEDESTAMTLAARRPHPLQSAPDSTRRKIADAARNNQTVTVRLMLLAGWPVDARGQHGATPLHWAAFHGNAAMTEELLRAGAPLEATDLDYQGTPLGWANHGEENGWHRKTGNYPATREALLRAGAKPKD